MPKNPKLQWELDDLIEMLDTVNKDLAQLSKGFKELAR